MENRRKTITRTFDSDILPEQILSWGKKFDPFVVLNSNVDEQSQKDNYSNFDILIAAGSVKQLSAEKDFFPSLKKFHSDISDWLFGYISYDVKNQLEKLSSDNFDGINAASFHFFCPRYLIGIKNKILSVHYLPDFDTEASAEEQIKILLNEEPLTSPEQKQLSVKARISRDEYINKVNGIKAHIKRGDIYEMNFCMEFYAEDASIDPPSVYSKLNNISPMPFSAYYHYSNQYLICASPERFIAKRGNKIISQPIKGTAKRGANQAEDSEIIEQLRNDPKERSENVMIVDLVRNDLSRTAARGSVKVEELFGIKSYKQLHQMVSTVVSEMKEDVHFSDVIRNAFPMGSMTGAPKISAMEIIEEYENTKRGIYSGTLGYITPEGDFDFNVIIRSILFNSQNGYLSFMAGSAITDSAVAEKEYEECLLKAEAMRKVIS